MILDYPDRLNVITKILTLLVKEEAGESVRRDMMRKREIRDVIAGFEDRRGPQAEEYGQASRRWKRQGNRFSPRASERKRVLLTS